MFYEIFLDLCIKNGKKPNQVTKDLGLSNATATNWKQGSVPRDVTLRQIAAYFNVSVDYLLGKEEKPADEGELSDAEKLILELFRQIPEEQQEMVLHMIRAALGKKQ